MGRATKAKDPNITYNACVAAIRNGQTQKFVIGSVPVCKKTLKKHLLSKGTCWADLVNAHRVVTRGVPVPPSIKTPPATGNQAKTPFTPFDPIILMMDQAKHGSFPAAKYLIENIHLVNKEKPRPAWNRPKVLNPRQNEIMDAICDTFTQFVLIEGDRRTGKSTAVWAAIHEDIWNGTRKNWGMWAAIQETASKIHCDVYSDPITWDETSPLHNGHSMMKTAIMDGSLLVNATTVSASSGKQYHGIWVDEMHTVLKDNPAVLATIAAILRSEPNIKMVLSMNKGSGAYEAFKEEFKPLIANGRAKFFTLEKDDTTHISQENDDACRIFMNASMGEAFTKRQLDNETTWEGDAFPPYMIIDAMNGYDEFMPSVANKAFPSVVGVDPGYAHATGVWCGGIYRGHIFELESTMLAGNKNSEERIKAHIAELANDYCAEIVCESNSGGLHWMDGWRSLGFTVSAQNFENNPLKVFDRKNMLKIIREAFEQHRIHICSKKLQLQLLKYNPDKDKNDSKGDLADAFIHAVFKLLIQYRESDEDEQVVW